MPTIQMDTTVPAKQPWEQPETPLSKALAEIARLQSSLGMALAAAEHFQAEWWAATSNDGEKCAACGGAVTVDDEGMDDCVVAHKPHCPAVTNWGALAVAAHSLNQ